MQRACGDARCRWITGASRTTHGSTRMRIPSCPMGSLSRAWMARALASFGRSRPITMTSSTACGGHAWQKTWQSQAAREACDARPQGARASLPLPSSSTGCTREARAPGRRQARAFVETHVEGRAFSNSAIVFEPHTGAAPPSPAKENLAALVPAPYMHLRRFYGVFGSHHHLRAAIVPTRPGLPPCPRYGVPVAPKRSGRMNRADLLMRVWAHHAQEHSQVPLLRTQYARHCRHSESRRDHRRRPSWRPSTRTSGPYRPPDLLPRTRSKRSPRPDPPVYLYNAGRPRPVELKALLYFEIRLSPSTSMSSNPKATNRCLPDPPTRPDRPPNCAKHPRPHRSLTA